MIYNNDKPKNYGFVTGVIKQLLEMKLKTSTSFRALALNFMIQIKCMNININTPTHTTILNWMHKIGYYQLTKPKPKAKDWIIILDESIQVGQEKILMIFGIQEKDIDFSRPLKLQDLTPLCELVNVTWTGEEISDVIKDLKKEIGGIKYAGSDQGSNIVKGLRLSNIFHVGDLTHKIARILNKIFKKHDSFKRLTNKMSEIRTKYLQTDIAFLIPPKQRTKSRYLNISDISNWCVNTLRYYERNKEIEIEICKKIAWITEYKDFITELSEIDDIICRIEKELKHNGFSDNTWQKCDKILQGICSNTGKLFRDELNVYFKELKGKMIKTDKLVITSDIIESSFGKYKNYVSKNPMAGITNLILSISAFTCSFEKNEIKEALEATGIAHVKEWTKKNIGETLFQKRKMAYSL